MNYDDIEKNDDLDFEVFFCTDDNSFLPVSARAIIFSPIDDDWNDFKYKCSYNYIISYGDEREWIRGKVFLGFVSTENRVESNGRISKNINVIKADEMPDFFTLQGGMQDYRHFVSKNGVKESNRLLLALNDLVASKRLTKRAKLVEEAMKTSVFSLAFMRDSGRFFAFHNASSLLDGLEWENFSSISTKLSLSYTLAGLAENNQFDMNFETNSILPKRICVLIGRNGIGKSQALHTIVSSLVKGDERFYDRELGRPMISRLLAIATPGETINTFPPERANKRIKYRRLILNRSARAKLSRRFCDLCVQLVRSEELIGNNNRWELFKESIKFFPNIKNIVIPLNENTSVASNHVIRVKDKFYVPLLKLNHGGEQAKLEIQGAVSNANPMFYIDDDVFPLSSGQLAFIKFVVQACLFIENGTLVLLDEPETHLHPNFITKFIRILDQLLKLTGSIAIIATHSAYFVREVPRKQVLVFKEDPNGYVNIQNPRLKTFGAEVGAISYFVFEDEITNALVEDILEHFPKDLNDQTKFLRELKDELSSDIMMYICRQLNIEWQD
ncbi:MAG: AAA family ATPase [Aeromonas bestiarum]|jgi:energy-coupling factor transporter ATP-binding protein EcfA2